MSFPNNTVPPSSRARISSSLFLLTWFILSCMIRLLIRNELYAYTRTNFIFRNVLPFNCYRHVGKERPGSRKNLVEEYSQAPVIDRTGVLLFHQQLRSQIVERSYDRSVETHLSEFADVSEIGELVYSLKVSLDQIAVNRRRDTSTHHPRRLLPYNVLRL